MRDVTMAGGRVGAMRMMGEDGASGSGVGWSDGPVVAALVGILFGGRTQTTGGEGKDSEDVGRKAGVQAGGDFDFGFRLQARAQLIKERSVDGIRAADGACTGNFVR